MMRAPRREALRRLVIIRGLLVPGMPGSRSSKSKETISESRSTPNVSCVRSFDPIRKAVEQLGEGVDADDIVGNFACHIHFEAVLPALEAVACHGLEHPPGLVDAPAERSRPI